MEQFNIIVYTSCIQYIYYLLKGEQYGEGEFKGKGIFDNKE